MYTLSCHIKRKKEETEFIPAAWIKHLEYLFMRQKEVLSFFTKSKGLTGSEDKELRRDRDTKFSYSNNIV